MGALSNQFKTFVFLILLTGVLLGLGYLIGGFSGLTFAFILAIAINGASFFFSDKIVLMIYRAKEAKEKDYPDLYKTVHEVAHLAHIPMPKVYIIPTPSANAFTTGRNPKNAVVACTEGILHLLNKDELKGVIAHEMAHIKNRDILIQTIASIIAATISYVAFALRWGAFLGSRDRDSGEVLGMIALAILTPLIAMILQLAISRSREYLADETGARTIKNPYSLASALEKLHAGVKQHPLRFGNQSTSSMFILNPFSAKGLFSLFSTHPPVEERVKRLRSMTV